MSNARQTTRSLRWCVATCCVGICLASTANLTFAQGTDSAEWANESPIAVAETGNDQISLQESATRTPIQRGQARTGDQAAGDARSTSWIWVWLPIGVAVGLWWIINRLRRGKLTEPGLLPEGVVVPLGKRSIGGGQFVQLIRIGSRILVVTSSPEGLRTLTEITEPQEVERLVSLCLRPDQGTAGIGSLFGRPIQTVAGREADSERGAHSVRTTSQSPKTTRIRQISQSSMEHSVAGDSPEGAR